MSESFLIKLQASYIFFHKTPVVAASVCTERFWTIAGLKIPILMKTKPNSNATADAETH